jgi:hypothetical protein
MESKKINQLATNVAPVSTDLTIIGDPITGVSKKVTLLQIASLFGGIVSFYTNLAAFPATGSIDTIYCAKDTQKLYLWSGSAYVQTFPSQALLDTYQLLSAKGVANGYASLDSAGKVPIAQLPSSIMEYKGMWSASTNTPTLANGTGDTGDVYICNVAGSVNFGAGIIVFAIGDYVIYSGSIWQRSSGAVGTVTSVGLSTSGNAFTIGSSPVTTSGTITINGSGTSGQYINGAGNLTTFPSLTGYVPYTGATNDLNLSTHNLFANNLFDGFTNVAASGTQIVLTIASNPSYTITGSGGQTIKLPDSTTLPNGAIYSFNNNQSSGAISVNNNSNTLIVSIPSGGYAQVVLLDNSIAAGSWDRHFQAPANVSWSTNTFDYAGSITNATWNGNVIAINRGGTGSSTQNFVDLSTTQTIAGAKTFTGAVSFNSALGSPIIVNFGAALTKGNTPSVSGSSFSNIYVASGNNNLVVADNSNTSKLQFQAASSYDYTFPAATGTLALTSDLSSYVPYTGATASVDLSSNSISSSFIYGNGVSGIAGAIYLKQTTSVQDSASGYSSMSAFGGYSFHCSLNNGTLNRRFRLNAFNLDGTNIRTYTLPDADGTIALVGGSGVGTVTSVAALTLGTSGTDLSSTVANSTTTPVITLNVPTASASNRGALSSADWTTFNNKQNALTNPVTGTGTSGQVTYFNGTSTVTSSSNHFWDNTNGRLGIGTSSPLMTLDVNGAAYIRGWTTFNSTDANGWYSTMLSSGTAFAYLGSTGQFAATGGTATDFGIRSQNAIAFYTNGGNERMRITSGGNVGIGTTDVKATGSGYLAMQLGTMSNIMANNGATGDTYIMTNGYYDGAWKILYSTSMKPAQIQLYDGQFIFANASAGSVGSSLSWSERMRITSGGNVGIGTSSPNARLSLGNTTSTAKLLLYDGGFTGSGGNGYFAGFAIDSPSANDTTLLAHYQGALVFGRYTNANDTSAITERMRITSGGNVLIGTTTAGDKFNVVGGRSYFNHSTNDLDTMYLVNSSSSPYGMNITFNTASPNGTVNNFLYFADSSALRFRVPSNGGVYNYSGNNINLASDIRLKKDITLLSSEWDKLKQIEVVNFKYKDSKDETALYGAIAQQIQNIYPELVVVTREATDIEPEYYGLREQPFQWLTTKVLQEAMTKIEELSKQNEELSNRLIKLESK